MKTPDVTAVVVTYQSRDIVDETMHLLRAAHECGVLECVVVDNASTDGTAAFLESRHNWARIIASPVNMGYGRGCNRGLELARTRYVMFMNPDVKIDADSIAVLARFLDEHPRAGIVAPATCCGEGRLQSAGDLPTPLSIVLQAAGLRKSGSLRRAITPGAGAFQANWLCGAILMARRSLMDELGGFDPRFFLYFEETDLCRRARLRGVELWAVGDAVAHHVPSSSARTVQPDLHVGGYLSEHFFRSRFYYLAKHHGLFAAIAAEVGELAVLAVKDFLRVVLRKPERQLGARLRGPILALPAREDRR
ncbi:MAG TPA: glycosyltransferase family 2 protein [Planctomycetota bacterium]|nr:glycosyltransferase family 2 protein [Planctomycetota bacterium]